MAAIIVAFLLLGCVSTLSPTATSIPATHTPMATSASFTDQWQTLAAGLEMRAYVPEGNILEQILVLRVDPTLYTFRVHYYPGNPLSTSNWRSELAEATAFVNANFFDRDNHILGLLIADGVVYGSSYTDRGGTFAIQNGQPVLRSNIEEPYQGESYEQAVQAFPMLVFNGEQAYTTLRGDRATRRTVVAVDAQGRVLLIATPLVGLRLADLAAYLVETDLEIVTAMNLDGGRSTMMVVQADAPYVISSVEQVPAVLAIYAR